VRIRLADQRREVAAVHAGHFQIGDEQIDAGKTRLLHDADRRLAGFSRRNVVVVGGENASHQLEDRHLIVNHEQPLAVGQRRALQRRSRYGSIGAMDDRDVRERRLGLRQAAAIL
jgi:hypothetical protein